MSNNHFIKKDLLKTLFLSLLKNQKWNILFELIDSNNLDINTRDSKGRNALYWAIHYSDIKVISKLIKLGIDKNVTVNLSAINYAVYRDNVKVIKCLRSCGLDLNEVDSINSTPLIYALLYNKLNSINYLMQNDARLEHEDFLGNTASNLIYNLNNSSLIKKLNQLK